MPVKVFVVAKAGVRVNSAESFDTELVSDSEAVPVAEVDAWFT